MKVVKFIAGFIVGALGLVVSYFILTINVVFPILTLVANGSDWGEHVLLYPLSLVLNVLAICIGASFASKVWKWGIRTGAVMLALLAVLLAFIWFFMVSWIVLGG
jgi:hypothetical protein